ncbi:MAG: phosphonate ABC transporter, permease protein PhnE [Anaerolineae bacterium]|nr:phosphonate ABC transporter, permease protein PhnE [Anaerolineae bacterium]
MTMRRTQKEIPPSFVSAPVAGVASLIVPGLGQALARQLWRGLLLLASLATSIGLFLWRVGDLAPHEVGLVAKYLKAFDRRELFVGLFTLGIVILWLGIAWDAYKQVKTDHKGGAGVFFIVLALLFALGWQVGEIDLYKMITEIPDAWGPIQRIAWPWEAAIDRDIEMIVAGAEILSPCDELPPPAAPVEMPDEPYVVADPTCGDLTTREGVTEIPGTQITLIGRNFAPNTETPIYWADPLGNEFRLRSEGAYLSVMTDENGAFEITITMPYRLIPPSSEGRQIHIVEARQIASVGGAHASTELMQCIEGIVESIIMGMMATLFGIVFSIPISFLAARNLMSGSTVTMAVYYATRMVLNIIRSIEPLIWVLVAVMVVGLGPFAGILALTVHSIAALAKLYSESIESIDPGPIEAIHATGATRLQTIMFAVVPQMIPPFVSFSIYRWDINVRMSTVIGLVGGGGIGLVLIQYIRLLDYRSAGIAVWFIAITVAILDYVSAEIRQRFV